MVVNPRAAMVCTEWMPLIPWRYPSHEFEVAWRDPSRPRFYLDSHTWSFQIAWSIAKTPGRLARHVFDGGRLLRATEGRPAEVSKEFGTASRDLFGFTAFGKYFERIRPYRLEQPPAAGRRRSIRS